VCVYRFWVWYLLFTLEVRGGGYEKLFTSTHDGTPLSEPRNVTGGTILGYGSYREVKRIILM